ncbi:hypothetical protein [Paenibacillus apiarius]|uniref:Uncharacterized protein n=1 Tax=Paenibacillus apiarius TaxID=46240 RepID=A0ABT4DX30_9BACL|nr:hypothetical protein [Paenibacillus apiarius]MCY9515339.1 hypothetical protein [Paenibacillus apiarius]MCY9521795.1 hypothetical protein [Paenibacillus apiarius]MCY9550188.1 hypothetical protein [Paenibacillus apiarius]MCY9559464.1 hypothetical protein [Paenibacillus apiarius]MCY9686918.1 hypothetical protein [Paenibacillus apiarius]
MTRKWKSVLLLAVMAMRGLILGGTVTTAGMYVIAIVSAESACCSLVPALPGNQKAERH